MGRSPCCDKANVKKGPWSPDEDAKLKDYIHKHGTGSNWISLPQKAGLKRCGKSCRLRWLNYLRPDIKHGDFSEEEDRIICHLFTTIGSRWSVIASQLAGRTDNDIKNYWNTKLKKKLMSINNNFSTSQKTIPHGIMLSSNFIQPSSTNSSSSSSSPSSYSDHSNFTSFPNPNGPYPTLLEPISFSNHLLNPTNNNNNNNINATPFHQISQDHHQSFIISPMGAQNNSYHVKLADHSCSSSDAEYGGGVGVGVEEKRGLRCVDDGMWMEITTPLMDYGLEEIKKLISSSSCNNVFFDDPTH